MNAPRYRWPPNDYEAIWQAQDEGRYRKGIDGLRSETGEDPADLRAMPHEQYLRTTHWHLVRKRALANANHRCFYCGKGHHLDVHHLSYKRIGCEFDEDLMVLCRECHIIQHESEAEIDAAAAARWAEPDA